MYRLIQILAIGLFPLQVASAQGSISGNVSSGANPIEFAHVGLLGTTLGNATDVRGDFRIDNIPEGTYTLVVSSIGFETQKKTITLQSGKHLVFHFELGEQINALDEV